MRYSFQSASVYLNFPLINLMCFIILVYAFWTVALVSVEIVIPKYWILSFIVISKNYSGSFSHLLRLDRISHFLLFIFKPHSVSIDPNSWIMFFTSLTHLALIIKSSA